MGFSPHVQTRLHVFNASVRERADDIQTSVLRMCSSVRWCCRCVTARSGCVDDEVTALTNRERGVKVEHEHAASTVIVWASDVGKRMSSSVSSSSCSTSDPHTHCPSTDLYTPNYPQQPPDSIHSSTPYIKTINTHTEGWHIQTRSVVSVFWSPWKSCCHCSLNRKLKSYSFMTWSSGFMHLAEEDEERCGHRESKLKHIQLY